MSQLYAIRFVKFIRTEKGRDFAYAQASAWFQLLKTIGLAFRMEFEEVKRKEAPTQPEDTAEPVKE